MKNINNLLTSGHDFSDNENLQKFRFGLLNFMMVVVAILTTTNLLISFLGIIDFGGLFEKAVLIFLIATVRCRRLSSAK